MERASGLGTPFYPTHKEIIKYFHRFITSNELHSGIRKANVYSAAPYNLVAQYAQPASSGTGDGGDGGPYYFLSSVHGVSETSNRKSRAVDGTDGKGRWHTEAGRKRVEGTAGGYMSNFSYQEKTASGTTRPGAWLMVEYSIDGCDDLVIAKIYRSPRRQATNVPPSYMASLSAAVTNKILQEMERKLMSDDAGGGAVDHVESLPAELANYTGFPNHDNGNHGALQYAIAGQYNVSGGAVDLVGSLLAELANYTGFPNYDNDNHGALQYAIAGQYNVTGAAAAAQQGAPQFLAGQYNVSGAAATAYGAPQFLAGHYNVSGASHASAAAAVAAQQVSPGHADHAILGHSQTVLDARYEVQGQVAQHLIPEPAIVVGADEVVIPSTSGGLANLDFDADLYAWYN